MDPVTAITGALVSHLVGALFGAGNNQQQGQVLEAFLENLTTSFSERIENIVRDAFTEQNLLTIKADIMSGTTAYRTFRASQDETQLALACQKVIEARSLIFTSSQLIIDRDLGYMRNENIEQKGAGTRQHNQAFKASMFALQAVAALDMLILTDKVRRISGLRTEIRTRLTEYVNFATELKAQYLVHQFRRTWVKFESKLLCYNGGEGVGYHCSALCKARRFVDGGVIDTIEENTYQIDPGRYKSIEEPFNRRVISRHNADQSLYNDAVVYLTQSQGNIQSSITLWENLRNQFV